MNRVVKAFLTVLMAYYLTLAMGDYLDYYQSRPSLGKHALIFWASFGLLAATCAGLFLISVTFLWKPTRTRPWIDWLIRLRLALGPLRIPLVIFLAVTPSALMLYTPAGKLLGGVYIRLLIFSAAGLLIAILIPSGKSQLTTHRYLVFTLLLLGSVHVCASYGTTVTNYPFSLTWSEGNRLYDYSVYLGSDVYDYPGKLTIPYYSPGRHLLWGIIYAIPHTPIWLHRLWDALLWTVPYVLLGLAIARQTRFDRLGKWLFALWVFLFLSLGPIYTPLVLSAILVVLSLSSQSWIVMFAGVAIAGFYASFSRWTWMPSAAIWATILLLSRTQLERGEGWQRMARKLLPAALIALAGLAAGSLANSDFYLGGQIGTAMAFSQALLWYRLFPNLTFSAGILIGLAIAAGPLVVVMIWAVLSRYWQIHWLQKLAYSVAGLATLGVGLVASVKIGGGSNLHNLDMFLITLVILTGIGLAQVEGFKPGTWLTWLQGVFALILLIPILSAFERGSPLELPSQPRVIQVLQTIRDEVRKAQASGEVLFLDQRQLLTFGMIQNVPLISDYEKKYLMDNAMANDQPYFQRFYQDLAQKRFSLIVSEPLKLGQKDYTDSFGEENTAWVKWVAAPIHCYYKPLTTFKDIRVELLVPRFGVRNCP